MNLINEIKTSFQTNAINDEIISIREKIIIGLMALLLGFPPYTLVNNLHTITPQFLTLNTKFDLMIPYIPITIIIYTWVYTFAYTPLFMMRNKSMVIRTAFAFILLQMIASIIFYYFPTQIHRPLLTGQSDFISWGIALVYTLDKPSNCFPSLHVANAIFSSLAVYKVNQKVGRFIFVIAILISIVTLTTKQHYIADVLLGAIIGYLFYRFFVGNINIEGISKEKLSAPNKVGFVVIYFYLTIVFIAFIGYINGIQIPHSEIFK